MRINSLGLDVSIKKTSEFDVEFRISNEDEKVRLDFEMDRLGIAHVAEQFISALFGYDEDLAHKLYQEFGNVADLKEEIRELKEQLAERC